MFVCLGGGVFYDVDLTDCKGMGIIFFLGSTKKIGGNVAWNTPDAKKLTSSGMR